MSRLALGFALGFALLAGLNVAVLWTVALRRRRRGKVSMLAVVGVAFLVSIALHLVAFALRGAEFAFAWGMLTVPLVWLLGCLANLLAKIGWERRVPDRD
jgi:heme/copper-type cytochrome/quinol oxidase subunit 4